MYKTIPDFSGRTFEHVAEARRMAICYLHDKDPKGYVVIKERRRGVEGKVRMERIGTNKTVYVYRTIAGIDHVLNADGSFKR